MEYNFFKNGGDYTIEQLAAVIDLPKIKLKDLECKNIAIVDSITTKQIYDQSLIANYNGVLFGANRNSNLAAAVERIECMVNLEEKRAIKIVITSDRRIWADNTHWTIAYIIKYGMDVTLSDIPYYIVDFRDTIPNIISIDDSVLEDMNDIRKSITAAYEIEMLIKNYGRPGNITWTVANLMDQLGINIIIYPFLRKISSRSRRKRDVLGLEISKEKPQLVLKSFDSFSDSLLFSTMYIDMIKSHIVFAKNLGLIDNVVNDYGEEDIKKHLKNPKNNDFLIVDRCLSSPCGCLSYEMIKSDVDGKATCLIKCLYVDKGYRNHGIATGVLNILKDQFERIELECWYNIPANKLYKNFGFNPLYTRYFINGNK